MGMSGGGGGSSGDGLKYAQQAYGTIKDLEKYLPTIDKTPYQYMGDYKPDTYDVFQSDAPKQNVEWSPEAKAAQLDTLSRLQNIDKEGGFTPAEMAATQDMRDVGEKSRNSGLLQILAERAAEGKGGDTGTNVLAQLANNQGSADSLASQGRSLVQDALTRRLQAIQGSGQLAGQIRGQDIQQGTTQYNALADFNKNIMAQINQQRASAAQAKNAAQQFNLDRQEDIQSRNADLTRAIQQEEYNNRYNLGTAEANALNGVGSMANAQQAANAQRQAAGKQQAAGIGSAIGGLAGAYFGPIGSMAGSAIGGAAGSMFG